jgi:hypothetical protein
MLGHRPSHHLSCLCGVIQLLLLAVCVRATASLCEQRLGVLGRRPGHHLSCLCGAFQVAASSAVK